MTSVGDEAALVDIPTAAQLIGGSEQFVTRLIAQGSLAATYGRGGRRDMVAFATQRKADIEGLQEIADADEQLGLRY